MSEHAQLLLRSLMTRNIRRAELKYHEAIDLLVGVGIMKREDLELDKSLDG